MFRKLIIFIKTFFLVRKLKKEFRSGSLVFQPETLLYYIVEAHHDGLIMLMDEFGMIQPVEAIRFKDRFINVKSVLSLDGSLEYLVEKVDTNNYTISLQGAGTKTLQDLNEGEI